MHDLWLCCFLDASLKLCICTTSIFRSYCLSSNYFSYILLILQLMICICRKLSRGWNNFELMKKKFRPWLNFSNPPPTVTSYLTTKILDEAMMSGRLHPTSSQRRGSSRLNPWTLTLWTEPWIPWYRHACVRPHRLRFWVDPKGHWRRASRKLINRHSVSTTRTLL